MALGPPLPAAARRGLELAPQGGADTRAFFGLAANPNFSPGALPISRDASQGPGSYRDLTTDLHNCVEWQPEIIGQMVEFRCIAANSVATDLGSAPASSRGVTSRTQHRCELKPFGAPRGIIRRPLLRPTCSVKESAECFSVICLRAFAGSAQIRRGNLTRYLKGMLTSPKGSQRSRFRRAWCYRRPASRAAGAAGHHLSPRIPAALSGRYT